MQPQKYLTVFNLGIQNTFVYRWNYLLRAIFGIIPLVGTVFLWRAIFRESGGGMRGYDYGAMIYYYLLTILVSNLVTPTEDEWQYLAGVVRGTIHVSPMDRSSLENNVTVVRILDAARRSARTGTTVTLDAR